MGRLVEVTHISLGGQIDPLDWAFPYLDEEHTAFAEQQLAAADALLLGRRTYDGLAAAYQAMPSNPFVDRMNAIPKFVASRTLPAAGWNATVVSGDLPGTVAELKARRDLNLLRYGNGPLDAPLLERGLIDEIHLLLTPIATGTGRHLFEDLTGAPALRLARLTRFASDVVHLVYEPTG